MSLPGVGLLRASLGRVTCTTAAEQADREVLRPSEAQEGRAVTGLAGSAVSAENKQSPATWLTVDHYLFYSAHPVSGGAFITNRPERLATRAGKHQDPHHSCQASGFGAHASSRLPPWHPSCTPIAMPDACPLLPKSAPADTHSRT